MGRKAKLNFEIRDVYSVAGNVLTLERSQGTGRRRRSTTEETDMRTKLLSACLIGVHLVSASVTPLAARKRREDAVAGRAAQGGVQSARRPHSAPDVLRLDDRRSAGLREECPERSARRHQRIARRDDRQPGLR